MKLVFEIPIVFANNRKGAKHIFMDHTRLPYFLSLKPVDMTELREARLIQPEAPIRRPKPIIDYPMLAHEYKQKLESGEYPSRSALARSMGVSRAWITKVMKKGLQQSM